MVLEDTGRDRPRQRIMNNSVWAARNVDGAFRVVARLHGWGPVLLVDDMVSSRWTMTAGGWLLRKQGGGEVLPLALAKVSMS